MCMNKIYFSVYSRLSFCVLSSSCSHYVLLHFLQVVCSPFNTKIGGATGSHVNPNSYTLSVQINNADGSEKPMKNMKTPAKLKIKRNARKLDTVEKSKGEEIQDNPNAVLSYSSYEMTTRGNSFHYQITPASFTVQYVVVIGYDGFPSIKPPIYYEHMRIVPSVLKQGNFVQQAKIVNE